MRRSPLGCLLLVFLLHAVALAAPAVTTQKMPDPIPAENGMFVVSIPLDNMPADAAVQQARLFLSPGGTVMGDDRIHRLIVKDRMENIDKIKAHLKHADVALPMVRMAVDFTASHNAHVGQVGVTGVNAAAVSVNGHTSSRVGATGVAYDNRSSGNDQGSMSVVTMSGSEGVISIGENIPYTVYPYFFQPAVSYGYIAPTVVFQNVSTGFGVVPTVLGGDEILLKIYPRVAYQSATGPGVIRYMDAATEVRVRSGQSVQIAGASNDSRGMFGRILSIGSYGSAQSGSFVVTPSLMRDPYAH